MNGPSFPLPDAFDSDVVIYLTPWCPFCNMAKRLLDMRKIGFETHDVTGDDGARRWLQEASGQNTVPQIFIKGRSIGGFDQLRELDALGELRGMLT